MGPVSIHLVAITIAYLLDTLFGDPRVPYHPVVLMGRVISSLENRWNRGRFKKIKGCLATCLFAIIFFISAYVMTAGSYFLGMIPGIVIESLLLWLMIGGTSMIKHAKSVYDALESQDLVKARRETAMIVSRDTTDMYEKDMVRAVVESTGENISDSVTAPLFFALLGGAPLAVLYRFINTSDAMIGYKTERFKAYGWTAARLDDLLNIIPARLTAFVMTASVWRVRKASWREAIQVIRTYARLHESPNSGYGESAMAGILRIKLGGPTRYQGKIVYRPFFGSGNDTLSIDCMEHAFVIWQTTITLFIIILWIAGGMYVVLA